MKHTHQASEGDIDTCRKCGKDIRNEIHLRGGQTKEEYYEQIELKNKKMYEVLTKIVTDDDCVKTGIISDELLDLAERVILKAEGVQ